MGQIWQSSRLPPSPQNPASRVQSYSAVATLSPSFPHNGPSCDRDAVPGQEKQLLGPCVPTASLVWRCQSERDFLCKGRVCVCQGTAGVPFLHPSRVHQLTHSFIHLTNAIQPCLCVRHPVKALLKDTQTVSTVTHSRTGIAHSLQS